MDRIGAVLGSTRAYGSSMHRACQIVVSARDACLGQLPMIEQVLSVRFCIESHVPMWMALQAHTGARSA